MARSNIKIVKKVHRHKAKSQTKLKRGAAKAKAKEQTDDRLYNGATKINFKLGTCGTITPSGPHPANTGENTPYQDFQYACLENDVKFSFWDVVVVIFNDKGGREQCIRVWPGMTYKEVLGKHHPASITVRFSQHGDCT